MPRDVFHQPAAQQWAAHGGDAIARTQQRLEASALLGREQAGHGQHGQRHQPAAACTLEGAGQHQLPAALARAAGQRPEQKQRNGQQQHGLAAQHVGQAAVQRYHHRGGKQVGRKHPGQGGIARQVPGNGG